MKMSSNICLVDLETNGEDFPEVKITQIGAVMLERGSLREIGHINLFADGRPLSPKSIQITGITAEHCAAQQPFQVVGPEFAAWVNGWGDRYIMSSWGTHFDIPVLRWEYARWKIKFPLMGKSFCVKTACYKFFWERGIDIYRCGVETALRVLGMKFEGKPHNAMDDTRNEARILRTVMGIVPPEPTAQVKFGKWIKTRGDVPFEGFMADDQKSPYDT